MKKTLLLISLLGCAQPLIPHSSFEHYNVYIDPSFPPPVISIIKNVSNDWEESLHHIISFDIEITLADCKQKSNSICWQPALPDTVSYNAGITTSYSLSKSASIKLSTDNYSSIFIENYDSWSNWEEITRITATHELGHALGLEHDQIGTIMYKSGSGAATHITAKDIEQYINVHRSKK